MFSDRCGRATCSSAHGFRVVDQPPPVRPADRACTSASDRRGAPSGSRARWRGSGCARLARLAGDARGGALRVLVTGATGFTGGHLARALAARGDDVRALVRDAAAGARARATAAIDARRRRSARRGVARARDARRRRRLPHRRDLPAGRAARGRRTARSTPTAVRTRHRGRGRGTASAASCTAARSACTATSSIRRRTRTRRSGPATSIRRPSSKASDRAAGAAPTTGVEVVIARPTGIYGPGDRRLLKLFRGVARRRFVMLGSGRIYYHLTYIDDLVEGFRLCGEVPAAAGRTYILAGGEVTTLNELVALIAAAAGVPPPSLAPAGVAVLAGRRRVRSDLRAARHRAAALPPPRRLLHQEPRVRHHARARGELGYAPAGRRCARASAARWSGIETARVGSDGREHSPRAQDQLFDARDASAREKYAAPGRRPARPGARCSSTSWSCMCVAARAGRARASRCASRSIPRCSAPAAATSSSGRTSCCGIRTRSASATTSSIDDNCLLDAKGDDQPAASRSAAACSSAATRSCRARTATSSSRTARTSASTASCSRPAACAIGRDTLLAAYCYLIGGDHDFSDPSAPVLDAGARARPASTSATARGSARARRSSTASRSATARSSAPAPWSASRCRRGAIAVGVPARIVGQRGRAAPQ